MSLLHVFDMDGTLLRETTASLELARHLERLPDLIALEESFATGSMDVRDFAAATFELWRELTPEHVADVFDHSPWINGLPEVLADIRARGEHSLVVTLSPNFFAERLQNLGVDEVVASRFPSLPFSCELELEGILSPSDKVIAVDRTLAKKKLARTHCIAYGDSSSDIPLFETLRNTVAINASSHLQSLSLVQDDGENLYEAYLLAREQFIAIAKDSLLI